MTHLTMAQNEPTQGWRDRIKTGIHDRGDALKGRVEESIGNRLDQYQPQIAAMGTAYCVTQRTDLYYGVAIGGVVLGIALTVLAGLIFKRVGKPTL